MCEYAGVEGAVFLKEATDNMLACSGWGHGARRRRARPWPCALGPQFAQTLREQAV